MMLSKGFACCASLTLTTSGTMAGIEHRLSCCSQYRERVVGNNNWGHQGKKSHVYQPNDLCLHGAISHEDGSHVCQPRKRRLDSSRWLSKQKYISSYEMCEIQERLELNIVPVVFSMFL